jgi:hypothetical protein
MLSVRERAMAASPVVADFPTEGAAYPFANPGHKSWKLGGSHGTPDQRLFPGALSEWVCPPDLRQMDADTVRLLL